MNQLFSWLKEKVFDSLVFRLAGVTFLTFLAGVLIFSYVEYKRLERMEKMEIAQLDGFASTFSLACREAILTLNFPLIENYVSQISGEKEDLQLVAVFDRQGGLIYQVHRDPLSFRVLKSIGEEITRKSAALEQSPFSRYILDQSYLVVKPIKVEGKVFGWTALVFSLKELQQERLRLLYGSLAVGLILLLAFITGIFYLRVRLIRPVLRLTEASRELAEGNFSVQVQAGSFGELSLVERSFNEMAKKLKVSTDEMLKAQEALKEQLIQVNFLCELSSSLSSSRELSEVFGLGLEAARKIVDGISAGGFFLFDRKEKDFKLVFYQGKKVGSLPVLGHFKFCPYLDGETIEVFKRVDMEDEKWQPFLFPSSQSSIWIPLKSRRELIGFLVLESGEEKGFKEKDLDLALLSAFANELAIGVQNALLYDEIRQQYFRTIATLAEAIEAKDPLTRGHCNRVVHYATLLARRLGFTETQIAHLQTACYLHDVGKIAVPESILCKPAKLTSEEREIVKTHSLKGLQLVEAAGLDSSIKRAILEHHEWFDGSGYPDGKKGTEISMEARILSIVDAFEAMISERPYRPAKSIYQAQKELKSCAGTQFDPMLVTIFLEIIENKDIFVSLNKKER